MSKHHIKQLIQNSLSFNDVNNDENYTLGLIETGIKGVQLFKVTHAMRCAPAVYEPCIVAIVSGAKEAILDGKHFIYDENNYMVNKIFRESVCKSLVGIDRENTEALLNDSIYRYENTSPKQRDYLYKKNTERLLDYYANLGFIPLTIVGKNLLTFNESFMEDEGFWIYEGGLLSRSVKKTFKNYNKPKLKQ